MRTITFNVEFDRPIDLQTVQSADASWNGEAVDVAFSISVVGNLEIFRSTMSLSEAKAFLTRLENAIRRSEE